MGNRDLHPFLQVLYAKFNESVTFEETAYVAVTLKGHKSFSRVETGTAWQLKICNAPISQLSQLLLLLRDIHRASLPLISATKLILELFVALSHFTIIKWQRRRG